MFHRCQKRFLTFFYFGHVFYVFFNFPNVFLFFLNEKCHLSIIIIVKLNLTSAVMFCFFLLLLEAVGNV